MSDVLYIPKAQYESKISELQGTISDQNRRNVALKSACQQAYALIENGMEIRAKSLLGRVIDGDKGSGPGKEKP